MFCYFVSNLGHFDFFNTPVCKLNHEAFAILIYVNDGCHFRKNFIPGNIGKQIANLDTEFGQDRLSKRVPQTQEGLFDPARRLSPIASGVLVPSPALTWASYAATNCYKVVTRQHALPAYAGLWL